jgi:gamma-glutamyl hercynylcysteine S-oxide synthase
LLHPPTLTDAAACASWQARHGDAPTLATLLCASRADTLATLAQWQAQCPGLQVPQAPRLNPPLWELGHVGWFQGWWTTRWPAAQRRQGHRGDPAAQRGPASRPDADTLYDSSQVPHGRRWQLPLPTADDTRAELAWQLDATLALLQTLESATDARDDALYAFRLVLLHEDMHHEAALYMAAACGVTIDDPRWQPQPLADDKPAELAITGGPLQLGREAGSAGFAFDNEWGRASVTMAPFAIDAQAVAWEQLLAFVDGHGLHDERHWSAAGWHWLHTQAGGAQAHAAALRARARPGFAASGLSLHDAEAWCHWAGRRLPSEAEWVMAARQAPGAFCWGDVWEWTASAFAPFEGFAPHPYRDYSAPWFDGRPVLKGASFQTQPRLADIGYRNFFEAGRNDIAAGFRSCAR